MFESIEFWTWTAAIFIAISGIFMLITKNLRHIHLIRWKATPEQDHQEDVRVLRKTFLTCTYSATAAILLGIIGFLEIIPLALPILWIALAVVMLLANDTK